MHAHFNPLNSSSNTEDANNNDLQRAINVSLIVGLVLLAVKWYAYVVTDSAAILSDAIESIVHIVAVGFAVFSMWLIKKPADESHPYGHEKIAFFSAGIEGALIVFAALMILYEAIEKWISGLAIDNLATGTLLVAVAGGINGLLGWYLVSKGEKSGSLILVANGKHVLTDSWTSLGVIVGLLMTMWTGWLPFDPIIAIIVALNIVWSGWKLIRRSIGGLMDEGDPKIDKLIQNILDQECIRRDLRYHEVRYRYSGSSMWIEYHLLFPPETPIDKAHWEATEIEAVVQSALEYPVKFSTHLEPFIGHDRSHRELKNKKE